MTGDSLPGFLTADGSASRSCSCVDCYEDSNQGTYDAHPIISLKDRAGIDLTSVHQQKMLRIRSIVNSGGSKVSSSKSGLRAAKSEEEG